MKKIDIHGLDRIEANIQVDLFIKESFINREYFVLIIHGEGNGVLREVVWHYATNSEMVRSIEFAIPQLGGSGASVVYLNKKGIL